MMTATIIGAGSVGITLAKKLGKVSDFELVYHSDKSMQHALDQGVKKDKLSDWNNAKFDNKFIILCVKDNDIDKVVSQIIKHKSKELSVKIVFHTSGTRGKSSLSKLEICGCKIAAVHPFQTFYYSDLDVLDGIAWGVDSDDEIYANINELITLLGGKAVKLSEKAISKKALYHISAVAASNFMALSIDLAKEIAEDSGIDAKEFLPQILETTLKNNIKQLGDETPAITGPVVRGEVDTIATHIIALGDSINGVIYKNMCESLALMAFDKGLLSGEKFEQLMEILD